MVSPEIRSKFLHDITAVFFTSYGRVKELSSYLRDLLEEVAQASQAQVSSVSRALAEKGELPWLDSIPILHRAAYVESLQNALRENKDRWFPPDELASRELVVMLSDFLLHLKWP